MGMGMVMQSRHCSRLKLETFQVCMTELANDGAEIITIGALRQDMNAATR